MHEYSIVKSMINLCEKHANGKQIDSVVVKLGELGGVEPHFLKSCFDMFKEDTLCQDATMKINMVDIIIFCEDCKKETKVENFNFFCPNCDSPNTNTLTGQEMYIEYIELKD